MAATAQEVSSSYLSPVVLVVEVLQVARPLLPAHLIFLDCFPFLIIIKEV